MEGGIPRTFCNNVLSVTTLMVVVVDYLHRRPYMLRRGWRREEDMAHADKGNDNDTSSKGVIRRKRSLCR